MFYIHNVKELRSQGVEFFQDEQKNVWQASLCGEQIECDTVLHALEGNVREIFFSSIMFINVLGSKVFYTIV